MGAGVQRNFCISGGIVPIWFQEMTSFR